MIPEGFAYAARRYTLIFCANLVFGFLLDFAMTFFITGELLIRAPIVVIIVAACLTLWVRLMWHGDTRPKT
jgi:hypothetical protein